MVPKDKILELITYALSFTKEVKRIEGQRNSTRGHFYDYPNDAEVMVRDLSIVESLASSDRDIPFNTGDYSKRDLIEIAFSILRIADNKED